MALTPIQQSFLQLSSRLTGFTEAELWGTGMVKEYYDALVSIVGEKFVGELALVVDRLIWYAGDQYEPPAHKKEVRRVLGQLLAGNDPSITRGKKVFVLDGKKLGPVLRNIITMWYLGKWFQLPAAWRDHHGVNARDVEHVISAKAYRESLVWVAAGTHPMGAKQPGWGTWALGPSGDSAPTPQGKAQRKKVGRR